MFSMNLWVIFGFRQQKLSSLFGKNSRFLRRVPGVCLAQEAFLPFCVGRFPCPRYLLVWGCQHRGLGRQNGLHWTLPYALRQYLISHPFVSTFSFSSAVSSGHPNWTLFLYLFCIRVTDIDISSAMPSTVALGVVRASLVYFASITWGRLSCDLTAA